MHLVVSKSLGGRDADSLSLQVPLLRTDNNSGSKETLFVRYLPRQADWKVLSPAPNAETERFIWQELTSGQKLFTVTRGLRASNLLSHVHSVGVGDQVAWTGFDLTDAVSFVSMLSEKCKVAVE